MPCRARRRWDYCKEKLLALGTYPEVSLNEALGKREVGRKKLADGIDPDAAKQPEKRSRQINAAEGLILICRASQRKS